MDLLQAIWDHYKNGTEPEAVKLRELIGTDSLVIYDDQKGRIPPYVIIEEGGSQPIANALGNETTPGVRFDADTVIFSVYAPSRSEVVRVLDAIEDCFLRKPLVTTGKTCLGRPTREPRPAINKMNDLYQGQTHLVYLMAKI
jgi:hypothetical protein